VAVQWRDIDFKSNQLSIVRAADAALSKAVKKTKTLRSRDIALDPELISILKRHKELRTQLGAEFVQPDSYVFGTLRNEIRTPNDVTAQWARRVREAQKTIPNLPWLTIHGLRHTHATMLLQADVSPKLVQQRLGHSNIGTTFDTYTHVPSAARHEAVVRFGDWFRKE